MATTLANYLTYMNEDYLRDPSNRIRGQTTKERAINKGYLHVCKEIGYNGRMQSTSATSAQSASDNTYTLPTDFRAVDVVEWDGSPLELTTREDTVRMDGASTSAGVPSSYYIGLPAGNGVGTMYIRPTPVTAGTLSLYYYASLPVLTSGVDSSLPVYVDDAVMLYASYKLLASIDAPKSQLFHMLYQEKINDIKYLMGVDVPYRVRNQRVSNAEYSDRI